MLKVQVIRWESIVIAWYGYKHASLSEGLFITLQNCIWKVPSQASIDFDPLVSHSSTS
jgi:hypothetical protein